MSEIWFTSDTHFGHARIAEYQPNRLEEFGMRDTSDIDKMNEMMVLAWNDQVAPDDLVIHLGDFAMGQIDRGLSYVSRLNGRKILVMGNHDRPHPCYSRVPEKRETWHERYLEAGFEELVLTYHWDFDGIPVVLNHFPYVGDTQDEERYSDWRPLDHGQILVHGHVHGMWQVNGRQVNVGMDAHGGRLLHETEVAELVASARL